MVRRPVRALLASASVGRVHRARRQAPERICGRFCPDEPRVTVRHVAGHDRRDDRSTLCDDRRRRMAAAGHDRRPCAARRGDGRRVLQRRDGRRHRDRRRRATNADAARFPHAQADLAQVSRRRLHRRQSVRASTRRAVAPAIELWRSVEQDRKKGWRCYRCSARPCCSVRCCD